MSARTTFGGGLRLMVAVAMSVGWLASHARDWRDMLSAPLADPLLVNQPQLQTAKVLSGDGDGDAVRCEDVGDGKPAEPLTLAMAVELALCHRPQVQGAWAAIKVQAAQVGEARAAYLPTLALGASRLHQTTTYPESLFTVDTDRKSTARYATLTWRLLDMGGRDANRRSANALLDAALASHDAELQKTVADVVGTYFEAQTAKAAHEAKLKSEHLAQQVLEATKKREAAGASARSDTLQAQTVLAKAELDSARAQGAYEKALSTLAVTLGWPPQAPLTGIALADDNLDTVHSLQGDLATWLRLAQQQHPALLAARSQLQSAQQKLTVASSQGLPTLDFTLSRYVNGVPNQGLSSTEMKQSYSGVTLNIPLFDGFGRTYQVRGALAQVEVQEAQLREAEARVLGEVARAHADAMAALRNLESSARLMAAATAALDEVHKKYGRGVSDMLEMLGVQGAVAQAEEERILALAQWRSARLRLLAGVGAIGRRDIRVWRGQGGAEDGETRR